MLLASAQINIGQSLWLSRIQICKNAFSMSAHKITGWRLDLTHTSHNFFWRGGTFSKQSFKEKPEILPKRLEQFVTLFIQLLFFFDRKERTLWNWKFLYLKYFLFSFALTLAILYRRFYVFLNLALDFLAYS